MAQLGQSDHLFAQYDMFSTIENQKKQLQTEVDGIPEQRLLNSSTEDLVIYMVAKYLLDVPRLLVDKAEVDQSEAMVQGSSFSYGGDEGRAVSVHGTEITLEIPFEGDRQMFRVRPSTHTSTFPLAEILENAVVLRQRGTDLNSAQVQCGFDRSIEEINSYLAWQRKDAEGLNSLLPSIARQSVERRKEKLLANLNTVAGLSFKLKERSNTARTYAVPIVRERIAPRIPSPSSLSYQPEPILPEGDYQNILKIFHDMTLVMERSPSAFTLMGEEDIRQHFLVQLNGQYEGEATGETFNSSGKTDILIRHQGRNVFIAECKFWRGEKGLLETIDQLLSYLSWRDTKAAIVVFNRNRKFSAVLDKIRKVTPQHSLYKSGPNVEGETRFRYVFGQIADSNREVILTILAFDVPQAGPADDADGSHDRA